MRSSVYGIRAVFDSTSSSIRMQLLSGRRHYSREMAGNHYGVNMKCECDVAGWCERYQKMMVGRLHDICRGSGVSEEDQQKYHMMWMAARGKGAETYYAPRPPEPTVSKIGTRLGEIFRKRVGAVSCGPCAAAIRSLDKMTPEQVREKEDEIVAEIASRAQKNMPNWFKKLLVKVDQTLHTGVTEHLIREYLQEACKDETQRP